MIVYHEAAPSAADSITRKGLYCTSRGEKGDDSVIVRTDALLDDLRPDYVKEAGVSRDSNLYAYIFDGEKVVDITKGQPVNLADFIENSNQALFRLTVNPDRCYVSDLDAYDLVKQAVERGKNANTQRKLAKEYWVHLIPLNQFAIGSIRRPEVMITYDISPSDIEKVR